MQAALPALRRLGIMLIGIVAFLLLSGLAQVPLTRAHAPVLLGAPIATAIVLALYWAIQRLIERRAVSELRVSALAPGIVSGVLIGLVLFTLTIAVLRVMHVYSARYSGFSWALLTVLLATIAAATGEELLFRGFLYRTVRDQFGVIAGVVTSAVLFGLAHAFNHGATVVSTLAVAVEAGILLSVAYQVTNALWLPIGIHIAWNFAEASIFGTAVSGSTVQPSIYAGTLVGPPWLTGGQFGPEASVAAIAVCVTGAALLWRARHVVGSLEP